VDLSDNGESHSNGVSSAARRHTPGTSSTRHSPAKSESVVEVIVDDSDSEREEEHDRHSARKQSVVSSSFGTASSAVSTVSAGRNTQQSGAGFRHQSVTHVTYNIKNKENGRQLFVSAPVGSREALVHDQVAARAANAASVSISCELLLPSSARR
jgi:hypothetical protein